MANVNLRKTARPTRSTYRAKASSISGKGNFSLENPLGGMQFDTRFEMEKAAEVMNNISVLVSEEIKNHLREVLNKSVVDTRKKVLTKRSRGKMARMVGGGTSRLPALGSLSGADELKPEHYEGLAVYAKIAASLGYALHFHNQHQIGFKAGSYDRSDSKLQPTGVRGSRQKSSDPSLTEMYERQQSPFRMKGFIGKGSSSRSKLRGYVSPGITSEWKRHDEMTGSVLASEKGYGKGMTKLGKSPPMITHPGWDEARAMGIYHRNTGTNLRMKEGELKLRLDRIIENNGAGQMTFPTSNTIQMKLKGI